MKTVMVLVFTDRFHPYLELDKDKKRHARG
jgi:hypothetical protein